MANPVCEVLLTENELETPSWPRDVSSGGIVEFRGVVRALEMGREIEGIDYEANRPMAEHQLRNIAEEAVKKFGVNHFIVSHRLGFVRAGEASLFLRVTSQNRAEAFAASQWAVDELKKRVPIWKQPRFKGETLQKKQAPKFETQPIVQK